MFRNFSEKIKTFIEIKQSEKKIFQSLFIHSFLIGLSLAFFFVEASRSFIQKVDISEMPVAYVISGVSGYLLIRIFKSLQKKYGMFRSFELIILLFSVLMLFLFFGRFSFEKNLLISKLIAYGGFVLIFAFFSLFSLGFSGICFSIFDLSQSKRLLALLGTGEIIASILAYLVIPIIVKLIGTTSYLLIFSAAFSILSIIPIRKAVVESGPSIGSIKKIANIVAPFNLNFILKNPFILYLSLSTLFSIIAVYFIDYSYLISVRYFSTLTGIEIATIVSLLFSIIKTGELFFSFFSSNIISAGGMKRSILLLPILLIAGALMGVFSLLFFESNVIFVIFFVFINKWTDRVIRKGVTIPSTKIMFQINTPEERLQLQNNIDGVISQLSTIICGVLLVVVCYFTDTANYNTFLKLITIVCLLVFVIFFWLSSKLYFTYKNRIQDFLHSSNLEVKSKFKDETTDYIGFDNFSELHFDSTLNNKFSFLLLDTDLFDQNKIRKLICYYNPSANAYINFSDDNLESLSESNRKLTKLYFENQNIFSRLLIMSNFLCLDFEKKLIFFKDVNSLTPLSLRSYYLRRLCESGQPVGESHVFYFIELVKECVNEILWTEITIDDLSKLEDNKLLVNLNFHREELFQMLLYSLELLHEKKSIGLVREILNNKERNNDDLLFVVELLENMLRPELKGIITPIFEPISEAARRKKMSKLFFVNHLNLNDRLLDILMRDFNIVDSYTKQLALLSLREIDHHSQVLQAFCSSKITNLQLIAKSLGNDDLIDLAAVQKDSISKQFSKSFLLNENDKIVISRWVFKDSTGNLTSNLNNGIKKLFENNSARVANDSIANSYFEVDLLGPVLLYKSRKI
jgi:hypothetical protein